MSFNFNCYSSYETAISLSIGRHKVVRAKAANILQVAHLRHLEETDKSLDFWSDVWAVDRPVDIHVLPDDYDRLIRSLDLAGVEHHVKVADLGRAIEEERLSIETRRHMAKTKGQGAKAFDFENYHNYTEVRKLEGNLGEPSILNRFVT